MKLDSRRPAGSGVVDPSSAKTSVEMHGISKQFGHVKALRSVDLDLRDGEILGLVGDNAAGKSTLMKILAGALEPDEGSIIVEGRRVTFSGPEDARRRGISMVYQSLALFDNLDVASNIFVARERQRFGLLRHRQMRDEAADLLGRLKINISSPRLRVAEMSGGQRQMVACARALAFESSIIIMDEPTAALGVKESNQILQLVQTWRDVGHSIILITHRLPDILAIGDRVAVLKGGVMQGTLDVAGCSLDDLVQVIVRGRETSHEDDGRTP